VVALAIQPAQGTVGGGRLNVAMIDVVVPAFRNVLATQRCLDSLLAAPNRTAMEIIVVDDASPEPELVRYLREQENRGRITLLEQASRQGYAAAVDRAATLHPERDLVVVQSDGEVANDWLDRLTAHAAAAGVGVVGTFTSAAGSATYPRAQCANPMPSGESVATLDRLFAQANRGESVALPSVDGPCLYFRRECLAAVGQLGSAPLEDDYGAEIGFCLRAGAAGFRHLVAGDVFVGHDAHASYGAAEAAQLHERSRTALAEHYPDFAAQQSEVLHHDPTQPFARRVDLARLAQSSRPRLVFVSHPWGGGIRRYMNDLTALLDGQCDVLYLEPVSASTVQLHWPREGEAFAAYFSLPDDLGLLAEVLRGVGAARLHFQHVHMLPRAVLDLPSAVGIPYDCTLHDYYAICPQYHLVTALGQYCGEPDAAGCAACLAQRPSQWGLDIGEWRGLFAAFLRSADRVIAPSHDVAARIGRYVAGLPMDVWSHPERSGEAPPRVARVAVLGNLSPEKGLRVVAACAADAKARDLPLVFRVIGSTTEPVAQSPEAPLTICGQYQDAELPRLIAAEKPDVILFAAQVPETYAYTMSAALDAGLPIVASALGVLPERLRGHPRATLVPWNAHAAAWNEALLAAAGLAIEACPPEAPRSAEAH
jgi:GT2 family glycosyltransferase/glycosyltransferase involved in cell wall biosynthesis